MGSDKGLCDEYNGKCQCKSGFSGDKCEICPDGSKSLLDGCPNSKCYIFIKNSAEALLGISLRGVKMQGITHRGVKITSI